MFVVANYIPISIIPHIAKVFKSIVYQHLKRSFNDILTNEQHGFRLLKYTNTNSTSFLSYIYESIESGHQLDFMISGFKKAFYTVNHLVFLYIASRII